MGSRHARSGFGSKPCAKGRCGICADIFIATRVCWALRLVQTAHLFGRKRVLASRRLFLGVVRSNTPANDDGAQMRRAAYRDAHICCILQFRCAQACLPDGRQTGVNRYGAISLLAVSGWHED
jgi:hypothetical protein